MISQEVPRRNQNMNRPIKSTETESVIYKLPTNKSLGPDGVTDEFYQTIRGEQFPSETTPKNCRERDTSKLLL